MKVLICTLNSKYIHSSLAPWCLHAACKSFCDKNIVTHVFESTVSEKEENIISRIITEKAEAVAFSCYIWNTDKILTLCKKIKESDPNTVIILGGPEVAYRQKNVLSENPFVDFVLSGEGEIILPRLLDCISSGLSADEVDGVSFCKDGQFIIRNEVISESFTYPSPYCKEYLDSLNGRITYIETSRGCPFSCAYCLSGRCGKVRYKSIEQTKKEILLLAASGTKTVKFVDRTFNCDNSRATQILRFIRENYGKSIPHGVCFHFEISPDILKDSFIDEVSLAEKGSVQFESGIQSMNPATLAAIGRKSNCEKLCKNLRKLTRLRNCHTHTDLIAGLPEETYESFRDGFNRSYLIGADMLQLGFLKLLHGSPLRDKSSNLFTFSEKAPYEVIATPTMSKSDLEALHLVEKELERLHNSGRFRRTLDYIFGATDLSPFDFFLFIGKALDSIFPSHGVALDRYTDEVYAVVSLLDGIDKSRLRDAMLRDRIATNSSGIIPKSLIVNDSKLRKVKHALSLSHPIKKGVSRIVAILYSERKVIFCDRTDRDPVSGEYTVQEESFDIFGETFFDFDIDK